MNRLLKFAVILLSLGLPWCVLEAASTEALSAVSSFTPVLLATESAPAASTQTVSNPPGRVVRGLHVTAWMAGSKKYHAHLAELIRTTVINTVVIDVKEYEGKVYIPGVKAVERIGAYEAAMPDIAAWIAELKGQGVYTVARIVVFKDNVMPRKNRALAVKNPQGELWFDRTKNTWLDPYNQEAWRYNLLIALQASKLGFDEVQFDYIRFPTDGKLTQMRFAQPYSRKAAPMALVGFLKQARQLLEPLGTKISIDVFGLTTSDNSGMGIGQLFGPMAEQVDFICPMVYPSHYARGEYGIPNPNDQPYRTVSVALHGALLNLGPGSAHKLRPYLQDFSLKGRGIRYGKKEVRAQLQAAADLGVESWTLWNARCSYTLGAIQTPVTAASKAAVPASALTDSTTAPNSH